mgnify:CR=1 FL=1
MRTTGIFRGAKEVGEKLKEVIDAGHGEESNPEFAGELMGWMCERCGERSVSEMNGSAQILMYNATMQKTHLTHLQDQPVIVQSMILYK